MITIRDVGYGAEIHPSEKELQPIASSGTNRIIRGLSAIKDKYDAALMKKANEYALSESGDKGYMSDEEITATATSEADEKYDPKREKAENELDAVRAKGEKEKSALGSSYTDKITSVREAENTALKKTEERMARSGMTDSSVARLIKEDIREGATRSVDQLDRKYGEKVTAIDQKIRNAEKSYEEAMRGYEISYAIELEKKIDKYRAQRDKLIEEYNRSSDQSWKEDRDAYLKENEALNAAYEAENGDYAGDKRENYRERYDYVVKETKEMDSKEKSEFLSEHASELENYLGLYYRKFLKEIGG